MNNITKNKWKISLSFFLGLYIVLNIFTYYTIGHLVELFIPCERSWSYCYHFLDIIFLSITIIIFSYILINIFINGKKSNYKNILLKVIKYTSLSFLIVSILVFLFSLIFWRQFDSDTGWVALAAYSIFICLIASPIYIFSKNKQ